MNLTDSHCHLDDRQFAADRDQVIERALAAGVDRMLAVGTGSGPPDLEAGLRLALNYEFMFATVGIHPHDSAKATAADFARLGELARHARVRAVGEIGLDYHYNFSPPEVQQEVFRSQLRIAAEASRPVIIHTREAWDDTFRILEEEWRGAGILHCFTGGPEEARRALEMGFHISFAGIVTFPRAGENREAAALVPDDRLLVETDAPYLAPVPHRGKRNEPAFMVETVRKLAEVRGCEMEHIAAITSRNFEALCLRVESATGYTGKLR